MRICVFTQGNLLICGNTRMRILASVSQKHEVSGFEFGITFYLIVKMLLISFQSESHIINFSRQSHEGVNGIL